MMKIGTLCYATDQGLGILAKSFFDAGVVTDVLVVRHGRHETHDAWYPNAPQLTNLRDPAQIRMARDFCRNMDAMLFFETPFIWALIDCCRDDSVKTALMVMHECLHQNVCSHTPDLFLCPSALDFNVCDKLSGGIRSAIFLPVPVQVPWRKRERAEVFVHNAGHGGLKGRNGTAEILEAMEHIQSPAKILIRSQEPLGQSADYRQIAQLTNRLTRRGQKQYYDDDNAPPPEMMVEYIARDTVPYDELWRDGGIGDVFLFPERFNGCSLPIQEACAAGMLVMAGNRFPVSTWLNADPLIPVAGYTKERIGPPYMEYDRALYDPVTIAQTIDNWYGKDVSVYSEYGAKYAEENSWKALKPKYMEVLNALCAERR